MTHITLTGEHIVCNPLLQMHKREHFKVIAATTVERQKLVKANVFVLEHRQQVYAAPACEKKPHISFMHSCKKNTEQVHAATHFIMDTCLLNTAHAAALVGLFYYPPPFILQFIIYKPLFSIITMASVLKGRVLHFQAFRNGSGNIN